MAGAMNAHVSAFQFSALVGLLILFILWAVCCAPTDTRDRIAFRCVTLGACALYVAGLVGVLIQPAR